MTSDTERQSSWPAAPRRPAARRGHPPARSAGSGGGPLFDPLIRPRQQRRWDREAEGLGGLEVDHQLELCRLLDREVAGLGALEDLVSVDGGTPHQITEIRAITHQPTRLHMIPPTEKRWQPVPESQLGYSLSRSHVGADAEDKNGLHVLASHRRKGGPQIGPGPRHYGLQLQLKPARGLLQGLE